MKFTNLFQDPESDSPAPYADTIIVDEGGMDVKYGGETVAHVSFDDLDPFEIAFHAMPADWEPNPEWDDDEDNPTFIATEEDLLENAAYRYLTILGEVRGWKRS